MLVLLQVSFYVKARLCRSEDYVSNSKSEIGNVCKAVEGHCLEAMTIVHHHVNGRFDLLISEHQSVNPSREAISILSRKYKRFAFVHLVASNSMRKSQGQVRFVNFWAAKR